MKIQKQQNEIKLTNIPETVVGIVWAILLPVLWVFTAVEMLVLKSGEINWFDAVTLVILLICYLYWLFTSFRKYRLRYAICFTESGILEKRISWAELSEYTCEVTGSPNKTNEKFFRLKFVSDNIDRPVIITTQHFPQSKHGVFKDEIFAFCDAYFMKYGQS